MKEARGILVLTDPLSRKNRFSAMNIRGSALVFNENGRFLPQAQAALQAARRQHEWVCLAACGNALGIALALAAQLPVDRLALWMDAPDRARGRELKRLEVFARRNLALVASEILLIDALEGDVRRLVRSLGRHAQVKTVCSEDMGAVDLTAEWI